MKYEVTRYSKFGIKCYEMEEESDSSILSFFRGAIDHQRYRERVTIYNLETNKVQYIQNFWFTFGMDKIKEQFQNQLWATSQSYEEVLPYLDNPNYSVFNTFHSNGLFDKYYIGLR